jgi:hypothetical protein
MDSVKLNKKNKNNHPIDTSCLKKCLKWKITINTQGQKGINQPYFGDYLYSSNDDPQGFTNCLPIDINKAQLLAIDKGKDNRLKFNIEFDLSSIRTQFKTIDSNYGKASYDIAINVNFFYIRPIFIKVNFCLKISIFLSKALKYSNA